MKSVHFASGPVRVLFFSIVLVLGLGNLLMPNAAAQEPDGRIVAEVWPYEAKEGLHPSRAFLSWRATGSSDTAETVELDRLVVPERGAPTMVRVTGVFVPPITGKYAFRIKGVTVNHRHLDRSELWVFNGTTGEWKLAQGTGNPVTRGGRTPMRKGVPVKFEFWTMGSHEVSVSWKLQEPGDPGKKWRTLIAEEVIAAPHVRALKPGDGLENGKRARGQWKNRWGIDLDGGPGPNGPWGDPDKDGLLNWQEYVAKTNPQQADVDGRAGLARWEIWRNIPGKYVFDLTRSAGFPTAPDEVRFVSSLSVPTGAGHEYGSRLRGLIRAPATGEYTFHIVADDTAELWLGDTTSWQSKRRVARVEQRGGILTWTRNEDGRKVALRPEQTYKVTLKKNQKYYLEILHKQDSGGDHCAVSWVIPGSEKPVLIGADALTSWQRDREDLDDDGLPDAWQQSAGLTGSDVEPSKRHAYADADYDGMSNWEEWKAGLNPLKKDEMKNVNKLTCEVWVGSAGSRIADLVADPKFPARPDHVTFVDNFDFRGEGTRYGSRLRGYLTAPDDGPYVFHVSGNNDCILYLSDSEDKFSKRVIARSSYGSGWRSFRYRVNQESKPVELKKGRKYYIEVIFKRGEYRSTARDVTDHASVAWVRPGRGRTVIGSEYLSPYRADGRDLDDDDIPDDWERLNGLDPTDPAGANGAWGDPDGDWMCNLDECQAARKPLQADIHGMPGLVMWECWEGIEGRYRKLLDSAVYPLHPTRREWINKLEGPQGMGDSFGSRMRAVIVAPATGDYTFALAGDNDCRLWLSETEFKYKKKLIASVQSGTAFRQWDKEPTQVSAPVRLEKGKRYFIEAVQKEDKGRDHISVGWKVPGAESDEFQIIEGDVLRAFAGDPNDVDDDDLPDDWELANGLPVDRADGDGDLDGDGLTNREEYRYGTRVDLADTDNDGVDDGMEVDLLGTNPLSNDVAPFVLVQTRYGSEISAQKGEWRTDGNSLINRSVRGWIEYTLDVPSDGLYLLRLQANQWSDAGAPQGCEFVFELDGVPLSREKFDSEKTGPNRIPVLTPWLKKGEHTLRVSLHNAYTQRRIVFHKLELSSADGPDNDTNGVPDWVQELTNSRNTLDAGLTKSMISPACLEGRTQWASLAEGADFAGAPNKRWYANVGLKPDGSPTQVSLSFENGATRVDTNVEWTATNLLEHPELVLRQGDALRLTATAAAGGVGLASEEVRVTVEGQTYDFKASVPQAHQFNQTGEVVLKVTYRSGADTRTTQTKVRVLATPKATSPVFASGYNRGWDVNGLVGGATIEWDASVHQYGDPEIDGDGGTARYEFVAQADFDLPVLFRIGGDGPVLGTVPMRRVSLHDGDQTGTVITDEFDGVYRVSMPVVLAPVYEDVTARYSIFVGGVTYADGSGPDLELGPDDFSGLGLGVVEFLKLTTVQNSVCHRVSLWQGEERIAGFN